MAKKLRMLFGALLAAMMVFAFAAFVGCGGEKIDEPGPDDDVITPGDDDEEPDGKFRFEAEDAYLSSCAKAGEQTASGYSGSGYVGKWESSGASSAAFYISSSVNTQATLTVCTSLAKTKNIAVLDMFDITVNGEQITESEGVLSDNAGGWYCFARAVVGKIELNDDHNTIVITKKAGSGEESITNFDYIDLETDDKTAALDWLDPDDFFNKYRFEGEDADLIATAKNEESTASGYSGSGYVGNWQIPGSSSVTFRFTSDTAEKCSLTICTALAKTKSIKATDMFDITINGEVYASDSVLTTSTGGWYCFVAAKIGTFDLVKGANVITLTRKAGSSDVTMTNFDYIDLEPASLTTTLAPYEDPNMYRYYASQAALTGTEAGAENNFDYVPLDAEGESVTFTVNADKEITTDLYVVTAMWKKKSVAFNVMFDMSVNGGAPYESSATLKVEKIRPDAYTKVNVGAVKLNKGANTITFKLNVSDTSVDFAKKFTRLSYIEFVTADAKLG